MFQSIILARALCMCITSKIIFQMDFFMYNCLYIFYSHVNYSVTKIEVCEHISALGFYSHVNYSVTKILSGIAAKYGTFYSHVNYSVTKIDRCQYGEYLLFYSHVNYSVTKIIRTAKHREIAFTVT